MHNIVPLIPQYKFAHLKPPTAEQRKKAQDESEHYIRQMRHCRQCRADAVGLLGKDVSKEMFSTQKTDENKATTKVALTGTSKDGSVDTHFSHARNFLIFGVKGG